VGKKTPGGESRYTARSLLIYVVRSHSPEKPGYFSRVPLEPNDYLMLVSISPKPNGPKAMGLVLAPLAGAPNRSMVGGPRRAVLYREGWGHGSFHEVDCAAITHPETLPPEGALERREAPPTPLLRLVSAAASPSPKATPVKLGGRPPPHRASPTPLH
jgi:hypothetical protein